MINSNENFPPPIPPKLTGCDFVKEKANQIPGSSGKRKNRVNFGGAPDKDYAIALYSKKKYAVPPKLGFFSKFRATILELTDADENKTYIKVNTASLRKRFNFTKQELNEVKNDPEAASALVQNKINRMNSVVSARKPEEKNEIHITTSENEDEFSIVEEKGESEASTSTEKDEFSIVEEKGESEFSTSTERDEFSTSEEKGESEFSTSTERDEFSPVEEKEESEVIIVEEETIVSWQQQPLRLNPELMAALTQDFLHQEPKALDLIAKNPEFCVDDFGFMYQRISPQQAGPLQYSGLIELYAKLASGLILYQLSLSNDEKTKIEYITQVLSQFQDKHNWLHAVQREHRKDLVYDSLMPHLAANIKTEDTSLFLEALRRTVTEFYRNEAYYFSEERYFYKAIKCFEQFHELNLELILPSCIKGRAFRDLTPDAKNFLIKHFRTCEEIDNVLRAQSQPYLELHTTFNEMKDWLHSIEEQIEMRAGAILHALSKKDKWKSLSQAVRKCIRECQTMTADFWRYRLVNLEITYEIIDKDLNFITFYFEKLLNNLGNEANILEIFKCIYWYVKNPRRGLSRKKALFRNHPSTVVIVHHLLGKYFLDKCSQADSNVRDFLPILWKSALFWQHKYRVKIFYNPTVDYLIESADTIEKTQMILDSLPKHFPTSDAANIRQRVAEQVEKINEQQSYKVKSARKV